MRTIKVFPDYMGTGFWEDGVSIDPSQVADSLTPEMLIAVDYWQDFWEVVVDSPFPLPEEAWIKWWSDGRLLVDRMNASQAYDPVLFVYAVPYGVQRGFK